MRLFKNTRNQILAVKVRNPTLLFCDRCGRVFEEDERVISTASTGNRVKRRCFRCAVKLNMIEEAP